MTFGNTHTRSLVSRFPQNHQEFPIFSFQITDATFQIHSFDAKHLEQSSQITYKLRVLVRK